MLETSVPVFMVHKLNLGKEEAFRKDLLNSWYLFDNETLMTTFQRPTGVTRLLNRLPKETCILVVAFDEKTERPLGIYERKEWDRKTESRWREFLRDGTRIRCLQAKRERVVKDGLDGFAVAEEEKEPATENEKVENATT